jgi:hypothetical protein
VSRIIPAGPSQLCGATGHWPLFIGFSLLVAVVLAGCELQQPAGGQIRIRIEADGRTESVAVPAGSTAVQALEAAGLSVQALDRTEPPTYSILEAGTLVRLIRVEERFRTEIRSVPFDRQLLRNESLPEGEERLVQAGVNGQEELTYRVILEDGVQISETVIKNVALSSPAPEIVMLGSRSALAPVSIPGRLAYLSGGNAWLMETSTSSRRLIVNSGDLDGHVLRLSADGKSLLFTRRSKKPIDQEINTLWIAPIEAGTTTEVALNASNIIHFADWFPDSSARVAYSTVEPRSNAPGWQANNDLHRVSVGGESAKILDAQSGGVYGWWGTSFTFSPSARIAFARPDGVGVVIQDGGYLAPVLKIAPFQTRGDWAWIPGVAWGPDSQTVFVVDHRGAPGPVPAEESPIFDLKAISLATNTTVTLIQNVGMFALPSVSPVASGDKTGAYQIAFLQAIFPEQSSTSRYRLMVMDRDGSDRRELFPPSDQPGLEPQHVVWAPGEIPGQAGRNLCVVYQGNLWLVDTGNSQERQITSDGLVSGVDWK